MLSSQPKCALVRGSDTSFITPEQFKGDESSGYQATRLLVLQVLSQLEQVAV